MSISNKRQYIYYSPFINLSSNNSLRFINKDYHPTMFLTGSSSNIIGTIPIKFATTSTNAWSGITVGGDVWSYAQVSYNEDETEWTIAPGQLPNYNWIWCNGRGNKYKTFSGTTKNGKVYLYSINNSARNNIVFWQDYPDGQLNEFIGLPKGEIAFLGKHGTQTLGILTRKGNVYCFDIGPNFAKLVNLAKGYVKIPLENIVNFYIGDWNNWSYFLTENGDVYGYSYSNFQAETNIYKTEGLSNIIKIHSQDSSYMMALDNQNNAYLVYNNSILHTFDSEEKQIIDIMCCSNRVMLLYEDYSLREYCWNITTDETEVSQFNITRILDKNYDLMPLTTYDNTIPYINIPIDYYTYQYQSTRTNVIYQYRFTLHQNINIEGSRNVVNYVPNCGLHLYDKVI